MRYLFLWSLFVLTACMPTIEQDCHDDSECTHGKCFAGYCVAEDQPDMYPGEDAQLTDADASHADSQADAETDAEPDGGPEGCVSTQSSCFTGNPDQLDRGICKSGILWRCADGSEKCVGEVVARPEDPCNGLDDNCNGTVDDNYVQVIGQACSNGEGVGECRQTGFMTCSTLGITVCNITQRPEPTAEICDNKDNDCNGETDEGLDSIHCDEHSIGQCVNGICEPYECEENWYPLPSDDSESFCNRTCQSCENKENFDTSYLAGASSIQYFSFRSKLHALGSQDASVFLTDFSSEPMLVEALPQNRLNLLSVATSQTFIWLADCTQSSLYIHQISDLNTSGTDKIFPLDTDRPDARNSAPQRISLQPQGDNLFVIINFENRIEIYYITSESMGSASGNAKTLSLTLNLQDPSLPLSHWTDAQGLFHIIAKLQEKWVEYHVTASDQSNTGLSCIGESIISQEIQSYGAPHFMQTKEFQAEATQAEGLFAMLAPIAQTAESQDAQSAENQQEFRWISMVSNLSQSASGIQKFDLQLPFPASSPIQIQPSEAGNGYTVFGLNPSNQLTAVFFDRQFHRVPHPAFTLDCEGVLQSTAETLSPHLLTLYNGELLDLTIPCK